MKPIFFAWTRSFWLSVVGILIVIFGAPPDIVDAGSTIAAHVLPWTGEQIASAFTAFAPAILWLLALQQRSGSARPYTMNPKALD